MKMADFMRTVRRRHLFQSNLRYIPLKCYQLLIYFLTIFVECSAQLIICYICLPNENVVLRAPDGAASILSTELRNNCYIYY